MRKIKYTEVLDQVQLEQGHPAQVLPIIHFTMLDYSSVIANYVVE
jgi:hypothetical protein